MAITYLQTATSGTDGSSFTFASQNLGTADNNRYIVVGVIGRSQDGTDKSLSSITVGGSTATIATSAWNSGNIAGIAVVKVPTGATGDVVVTFSATMGSCAIALWSELNLSSLTASDTGTDTTDPLSTNITMTNGFIVAIAKTDNAGDSATWTNVDENFDAADADTNRMSGGSKSYTTSQTNLPVTCDWVTGTTRPIFACASFEIVPDVTVTGSTGLLTLNGNAGVVSGNAGVTGSTGLLTLNGNAGVFSNPQPTWNSTNKSSPTWNNQDKS